MQIKTITTVAGVNEIDFGNDDSQTTAHFYWLKNLGDSTLYVSAMPDPVAGEDNVAELSAKGAVSVETDEGKIYVLGAGKAEIHRTNSKFCPFDWQSSGSGGGGGGSIAVDSELSETSENPLQNKATTAAINEVKSDLAKTQKDVAENAAALSTKSDINHIHDITAKGNPVQLDGLQGGVPFSELVVSGKNLIVPKSISRSVNGINFTVNSDKSITINGTSTSGTSFMIGSAVLNKNEKYTLSILSESKGINIHIGSGDDFSNPYDYTTTAKTITAMSEDNTIWIWVSANKSFDNVTVYPQLELGDTATAYEPPITGRDLTVNVSGKNLLNVYIPTKREYVVNNTTFTINDDGSVTAVSAETEAAATRLSLSMTCPPGDYMFSGSTHNGFAIYIYNSTKNTVTAWANPNPVPCHIDKENEYVLYFMVGANCKANGDICKPQLEIGSVATEYEPYNGTEYNITPNNNPYTIPNDICQLDGLNNISVSAGELSVVGVQRNAAIKKIWDKFTSIDNDIVDLYSKISTLEFNTSASIEANGQEIVAVRHTLNSISDDVSSVTDNVAINTSDIITLKNGNEALRVEIDELRALIETT